MDFQILPMPAFYRTYRPNSFAEMVGQEHIVRTLENAIRTDRIGHAYLFAGPRGTGKTTLARLLAKAANCTDRNGAEPCGKCENCVAIQEGRSLDLIEIDAATHTQVEKMREVLEGVPVAPTSGRYKVYIVDEAHMLSKSSWNAFLKTLEEPPAHAVFILATTAPDKVLETVVSRCQRFDLTRFPVEKIVEKLSMITEKEKIGIEDAALRMIAIAAEGGMRDAESLLSQVVTIRESPITAADAALILGTTETARLESLAGRLADRDLPGAIRVVREISANGENFSSFLPAMLRYLQTVFLISIAADIAEEELAAFTREQRQAVLKIAETFSSDELVAIIEHFQEAANRIGTYSFPELAVEIAVAKSIPTHRKKPPVSAHIEEEEEEEDLLERTADTIADIGEDSGTDDVTPSDETRDDDMSAGSDASATAPFSVSDVRNRWRDILREATRANASLTLSLSNARLREVEGNRITLSVKFPFHRDRLTDMGNALTLNRAFDTILSAKTRIAVVVEENAGKSDHPIVSHALEALGGEIV